MTIKIREHSPLKLYYYYRASEPKCQVFFRFILPVAVGTVLAAAYRGCLGMFIAMWGGLSIVWGEMKAFAAEGRQQHHTPI